MRDLRNETMLILGDLVGFPTVTTQSNLELIEYAADRLETVGADLRITRDGSHQKANLLATIGPGTGGGVVLSGHTDVVPAEETDWTGSPFVAMRRDERIYGRGTTDMKGFIACALALAPYFSALPLKNPLHIALTFDEEVGCRGAPLLINDLIDSGVEPAAVIVGEPTGMGIVVAHKGMHEYTTSIIGLEGHGSQPDQAVNAVQAGTRYVAKLMELGAELMARAPSNSPYHPPYTTLSVGSMHGGVAHNIVAGECVIQWEMRPVSAGDADFVLAAMAEFERILSAEMKAISPSTGITTVTEGAVGGLEQVADSHAIHLVGELLERSDWEVAAFSTEAGLYQAAGIPAVVCGPGSIDVAHQAEEYVSLEQLEKCLDFMKGVGEKLSNQ